jgi:predicted DNA-binding ribbon-helix-helix protein
VPRNVTVAGRRTSVRLHSEMWDALREIADRERKSMSELVTGARHRYSTSSLTTAIRIFIVNYFRQAARTREPV